MTKALRAGSISVFFPAFNDEKTIARMVTDALALLPALADDYEVIIINDGSADRTAAALDELARTQPHVRAVHHPRNRGYGAALRTGFASATKELIFYTDGDGQYDVRELAKLLPLMTNKVEVVNGYKLKRADRRRRIVIGAFYNRLARWLFRLPIRDVDCDFRLLRRSIFDRVSLETSSGVICLEMMKKIQDAGFRITEVPVHHYHRAYGRSQFFNFRRLFRTGIDVLKLWVALVVHREHRRQSAPSAATVPRPGNHA